MPAISTKICAVSPTLELLRCHPHHYFTYLKTEAELWAIRYRYCLLTPSMVQTSTRDHGPLDTKIQISSRQRVKAPARNLALGKARAKKRDYDTAEPKSDENSGDNKTMP